MNRVGKISRLTLGLLLVIFGINGFTGFMGDRILPTDALRIIEEIDNMVFVIPFMSTMAIISGMMLLINILIPVAVTISVMLMIPVLLYHLLYHPRGSMFVIIGVVAVILVIIDYRLFFKGIFRRNP